MRILQTAPTTVAKITGMSLHPLPIVPVRTAPAPVKTAAAQSQNIGQAVQIKPAQQTNLRVSSTGTNSSTATSSAQPLQAQYVHPPHTTTYYSFEATGKLLVLEQVDEQNLHIFFASRIYFLL